METIMKPGEEITGHIRWEQPVLSLWGYVAGETKLSTFTIRCPEDGGQDWTLTSTLPGQRDWRLYCDGPDALRKAAEGWVTEFVSSLGAVFPEQYAGHSENEGGTAVQIQPQCAPVPPHPEEETGR